MKSLYQKQHENEIRQSEVDHQESLALNAMSDEEPPIIEWDATPEEYELIAKVAARAIEEGGQIGFRPLYLDLQMDINAAHSNGCPLDLQKLLDFPEVDFWHDIYGICEYINRTTGKLEGFFLPRSARRS
jgi:hypothetical protein